MKYQALLMFVLMALMTFVLPSCKALNKLVGADTVTELKKLYDSAPLVLETIYKGKVIRIVIKEPKTESRSEELVAVDSDGQEYSVKEVRASAESLQ